MFGINPKRSVKNTDGEYLDIQEIFVTLQGEGPLSGRPAVFVRLGGCNLACRFCDTEFESFSKKSLLSILDKIAELSVDKNGDKIINLVVITGGEPFRQSIEKLCKKLIEEKFDVQIETNGTLFRNIDPMVQIICSPKNNGYGYKRIREDLLVRITALKFIISKNIIEYSSVEEVGQSDYNIPVYIQPMDEYDYVRNMQNQIYTKYLALSKGYNLSLQIHKILEIA